MTGRGAGWTGRGGVVPHAPAVHATSAADQMGGICTSMPKTGPIVSEKETNHSIVNTPLSIKLATLPQQIPLLIPHQTPRIKYSFGMFSLPMPGSAFSLPD